MKRVVEELKRARQSPVIQNHSVARSFEKNDGKLVNVWALVPARGAQLLAK